MLLSAPKLQNILHALATPIDKSRQPEFLSAVTTRLEAQGPAAIGPGTVHRAARRDPGRFLEPAAGSSARSTGAARASYLNAARPSFERDLRFPTPSGGKLAAISRSLARERHGDRPHMLSH